MKRIITAKNATTVITRQGNFCTLNLRQFFRNQDCSRLYILVIFASMQLQILLISICSTDEHFCRMGSLAWLGYLSYTQVVESSNLSPSIIYCSVSFLEMHTRDAQKMMPTIQNMNREICSLDIINLAGYYPLGGKPFHYSSNTLGRLVQQINPCKLVWRMHAGIHVSATDRDTGCLEHFCKQVHRTRACRRDAYYR